MSDVLTPEICVIGGGAAGVALALRAAALGIAVVLVEKGAMGGENLAAGTIPSKALVAAAARADLLRRTLALVPGAALPPVDYARVVDHVKTVVAAAHRNLSAERLSALGVRVIAAEGRFADQRTVMAGEITIRARRTVIATGAVPTWPDVPGIETVEVLTPSTIYALPRVPERLVVLGAGAYGLEFAQAFQRLGSAVTVVDSEPALAGTDAEIRAIALERLGGEGVVFRDGMAVKSIGPREDGVRVVLAGGEGKPDVAVDGSHLLVIPGRVPYVDGLGLKYAGIAHDRNGIAVDRDLRTTTNQRVYAIGDAIAGPPLAIRAEHQAGLVLGAIARGRSSRYDAELVPATVAIDPPVAAVGLEESAARARHKDVRVIRQPFVDNDLCLAEGDTTGMVKAVIGADGQILGAAAIGRDAPEIIALFALAMGNGLGIDALLSFTAPYPSRSDIAVRAAALALGAAGGQKARRGLRAIVGGRG